jgi:diketogulonate reductase-like aldo/keto reductase
MDRTVQEITMEARMPLTAHNGIAVPSFMYGTAWKKDATARLVETAIGAGFRALDTANQLIHYNEAGVGEALEALGRKEIRRETLFIQTKFTPLGGQGGTPPYDPAADLPNQVRQSFDS